MGRTRCPEGVAILTRWWYSPAIRHKEGQPGVEELQQTKQEQWEEIQIGSCHPKQPHQGGPYRNPRNGTKIELKQRKQEWNLVTLTVEVETITILSPSLSAPLDYSQPTPECARDTKANHVLGDMALLGQDALAQKPCQSLLRQHCKVPHNTPSLSPYSASIAIWQLSQHPHTPSFPLPDVTPQKNHCTFNSIWTYASWKAQTNKSILYLLVH